MTPAAPSPEYIARVHAAMIHLGGEPTGPPTCDPPRPDAVWTAIGWLLPPMRWNGPVIATPAQDRVAAVVQQVASDPAPAWFNWLLYGAVGLLAMPVVAFAAGVSWRLFLMSAGF